MRRQAQHHQHGALRAGSLQRAQTQRAQRLHRQLLAEDGLQRRQLVLRLLAQHCCRRQPEGRQQSWQQRRQRRLQRLGVRHRVQLRAVEAEGRQALAGGVTAARELDLQLLASGAELRGQFLVLQVQTAPIDAGLQRAARRQTRVQTPRGEAQLQHLLAQRCLARVGTGTGIVGGFGVSGVGFGHEMLGVVVLEGKVLVLQQGQNELLVLVAQEHGRRLVQLLLDLATILRLLLVHAPLLLAHHPIVFAREAALQFQRQLLQFLAVAVIGHHTLLLRLRRLHLRFLHR